MSPATSTSTLITMAHIDPKESPGLHVERPGSENLEKGEVNVVDNTDEDEEFSYEEQRKIIHRIDRRLVVILGYVLDVARFLTSRSEHCADR
jgi:hypothetical protein